MGDPKALISKLVKSLSSAKTIGRQIFELFKGTSKSTICAEMKAHAMTGYDGEASNFYEMIAATHSKQLAESDLADGLTTAAV